MDLCVTECPKPIRVTPFVSESHKLARPGYVAKSYLVGCGRCGTCERVKSEKKPKKWASRLAGMVEEFRENGLEVWRSSRKKVVEKGDVFFVTVTTANECYPGASMFSGGRLKNSTVRSLNANPKFRARSYRHLRRILQRIRRSMHWERKGIQYAFFPEWGSPTETRRVHFHGFLFVPQKEFGFHREFISRWRSETQTTQASSQQIGDARKAAAYVSKYAAKDATHFRVLASQSNWLDYEQKFKLQYHGFDIQEVEGYTKPNEHGVVHKKRIFQGGYQTMASNGRKVSSFFSRTSGKRSRSSKKLVIIQGRVIRNRRRGIR